VDSTTYELHRVWLSAGRLIIENLARLTELDARTPIVIAPMKVRDANGAPARACSPSRLIEAERE
jgi:arylformamidase